MGLNISKLSRITYTNLNLDILNICIYMFKFW